MYQNTENQQKIIVGTKNIKLIRCARYGIAIGVISWIFIGYLNVGFAQTENSISAEAKQQENTTEKNNQNDNQNAGENSTLTQDNQDPNAKIRIEIITDNSTFFDPQDEKISRNAMAMILEISKSGKSLTKEQSASEINLNEQKQKARKKNKREMQAYNEKKNKKFNEYLQSFQKIRSQPVIYSGTHDDYTSYLQNFQSPNRR